MNTSGSDKAYHIGPCSECSADVDTRKNGSCYHNDKLMNIPPRMSVFLLCSPCIDKRNEKEAKSMSGGHDWMPGPRHQPLAIMPMSA